MNTHMKPDHYKPEEDEKIQLTTENGFTPASHAGVRGSRPARKPNEQARQAAEQATRNALMDCYNG